MAGIASRSFGCGTSAAAAARILTSFAGRSTYEIENNGVYCLAYTPDGKTLAAGLTRAGAVRAAGHSNRSRAQADSRKRRLDRKRRRQSRWQVSRHGKIQRRHLPLRCRHRQSAADIARSFVRCLAAPVHSRRLPAFRLARRQNSHLGYELRQHACDAVGRIRHSSHGTAAGERSARRGHRRDVQTWSLKPQPTSIALRDSKAKDPNAGSTALAFDEPGSLLAVAGQDELVRVWDVAKRSLVHRLAGHSKRTMAVAFGPQKSQLLASGGEDHKVLLWRLSGPEPIKPVVLDGHTGAVTCLAITPDGNLVVSGSQDGTVRLWDSATGKLVDKLKSDQKEVYSFDLGRDGKLLITGGDTGFAARLGLRRSQAAGHPRAATLGARRGHASVDLASRPAALRPFSQRLSPTISSTAATNCPSITRRAESRR